ncbi:MAG: hypothetical protein OXN89_26430 [Bryobacterales bacterium]|nr:hypothetical protein [Bryobacterales bacterium]
MYQRLGVVFTGFSVTAFCLLATEAAGSTRNCDAGECDKVAVVRCNTLADGRILVANSSVTSAVGVTVRQLDRCAATIAQLLNAGLDIEEHSTETAPSGTVSFNFVFLVDDDDDDNDDDDDEDDD